MRQGLSLLYVVLRPGRPNYWNPTIQQLARKGMYAPE